MAEHNKTGEEGEQLAADYLVKNGFTILHRNWRWGHLEVDVIACKNQKLHFVEVKTRKSNFYGYPEEGVSRKKITAPYKISGSVSTLEQAMEED